MGKYVKLFETNASAIAATDLLSPNVTYIGSGETLLMADVGDDKELEIKEEGGKIVIGEKSTYIPETYIIFNDFNENDYLCTLYPTIINGIEFESNGTTYTEISTSGRAMNTSQNLLYNNVAVLNGSYFNTNTWTNDAYKTLLVKKEPTDAFKDFLSNMARKQ